MDDPELQEIRARRLAELRGYNNPDQNEKAKEDEKKAEEIRNSILSQVLDQNARARLNTLMIAKPDKGQIVENMLISMAQRGQILGKLGEDEFKDLLLRVSEQTQKKTVVKFDRRRAAFDDSDEDLNLDDD